MKSAKDYIIFPLDLPSAKEAQRFVKLLSGHVGMFKVGLELFIEAGPEIIRQIRASGNSGIFLDLKLHDIPATVSRAMRRIAELGISFATVHCGESPKMLEAAVEASRGEVGILGVTVLTSISGGDIHTAGFRDEFSSDLSKLVMKRATAARDAGCAGIVCSGLEVKMIKEHFGKGFVAVTPGIRTLWDKVGDDDQQRVTSPAQAVAEGSDYLVIGRPIRNAGDPKAAAIRIAEEIEAVIAHE